MNANPNQHAYAAIAAADARHALESDRKEQLNDSVSNTVRGSQDPAVLHARRVLHMHRRIAQWLLAAVIAIVAVIALLSAVFSVPTGVVVIAAGALVVAFICFTNGLTLQPDIYQLRGERLENLLAYARARGIRIDHFTPDVVSADLLGGWMGDDGYNVRTDRLHPDFAETQSLLDQWASSDTSATA